MRVLAARGGEFVPEPLLGTRVHYSHRGSRRAGPASLRDAMGFGVRDPVVPGLITGLHHRLMSDVPPGRVVKGGDSDWSWLERHAGVDAERGGHLQRFSEASPFES